VSSDEKASRRKPQATEAGALWWEYMVAQPLSGELTGNVAQASASKRLPG
jgi:hypothetical protein